jgi:hypothetical protein
MRLERVGPRMLGDCLGWRSERSLERMARWRSMLSSKGCGDLIYLNHEAHRSPHFGPSDHDQRATISLYVPSAPSIEVLGNEL